MRQSTVRRLIPLQHLASAIAVVGCALWFSDARCEPRYWAGDVSFVRQASYEEAVPAEEPTPSSPLPNAAPEPALATPDDGFGSSAPVTTAPSSNRSQSAWNNQTSPVAGPQPTVPSRQPIGFYSGRFARSTPVGLPRRMPIQPSETQRSVPRHKPFESAESRPTITPYLNLYREETDSQVLPSYYAFVRPQLEQQESALRQQRELEQRERRPARGSAAAGAPVVGGGPGVRSLPARFMNTAQFYNGWQR